MLRDAFLAKRFSPEKSQTGFSAIEILLVLVIVLLLCSSAFQAYFKKSALNKDTEKMLKEEKIDTKNSQTITDSFKDKLQGIQNQNIEQLQEIEEKF